MSVDVLLGLVLKMLFLIKYKYIEKLMRDQKSYRLTEMYEYHDYEIDCIFKSITMIPFQFLAIYICPTMSVIVTTCKA